MLSALRLIMSYSVTATFVETRDETKMVTNLWTVTSVNGSEGRKGNLLLLNVNMQLHHTSLCCFTTSETSFSGTYSSLTEVESEVSAAKPWTTNFSGVFNRCCSSLNRICHYLLIAGQALIRRTKILILIGNFKM